MEQLAISGVSYLTVHSLGNYPQQHRDSALFRPSNTVIAADELISANEPLLNCFQINDSALNSQIKSSRRLVLFCLSNSFYGTYIKIFYIIEIFRGL